MRWENIHFIRQFQEFVVDGVIEIMGQCMCMLMTQQISARRAAYDQRAATEQCRRSFSIRLKDKIRYMFRRMTGRRHHADLESTHIYDRIFTERLMVETNFSLRTGANLRAGLMCDLAAAGDEVRVQVGVQYMCERKPALGRGMKVTVHVAERIDQNPFFGIVRADQIRGIAQSGIYKWFDEVSLRHNYPYEVEYVVSMMGEC